MLNYILVALIFGAGICAYLFKRSLDAKKSSSNRVVEEKAVIASAAEFIDRLVSVPARVYDNVTRTIYNIELPAADVRQVRKDYGNLGRRWFRDGEWRYALVHISCGSYVPVQKYMSLSLKNPPEKLHRALQQQETETFYKPRDTRSTLGKYGAYILVALAVLGVIFVWGSSIMKGGG